MKCKENGCGGELDQEKSILLKTSCGSPSTPACPCKKCGRLHWTADGGLVYNRPGDRAFLEKGSIVMKNEKNEITCTL